MARRAGLSGVLVTNETNVGYLTGFSGDSSALLVETGGRDTIVSDGRYTTQLAEECPEIEARIRELGKTLAEGIGDLLWSRCGGVGGCRIGFEAGSMTVATRDRIAEATARAGRGKGGGGPELEGTTGLVESLRSVKDAEEVEQIREAVRIAERAFERVRAGLSGDDTEKEIADELEAATRRCGGRCTSFPVIVASGPNAALPHARATSDRRFGEHEFTLLDWGASGSAYKSDLTRMLAPGKVSAKFEKVYRTVLAARDRAIAAIAPGVAAREIDAAARGVIADAGFGDAFRHALGHGVGRDIHESPGLRGESTETLKAGMVVTVEPGIYLPGWGGVRIEDDVLVTADGRETLSRLASDWDSVRFDRYRC